MEQWSELLKTSAGLKAGDYTVTVTDANGCNKNMQFTVETDVSTITITPVVTNTTCTASIGAINITVSVALHLTPIYGANGATTEDISGLKSRRLYRHRH
jgi:hypothetical protein